ncbi:MAG: NAD(P)/FAD-dependent oxidoreductase [Vulcanisaeta sp.]
MGGGITGTFLGYFLKIEGYDVTIIHNRGKLPLVDLVFSNMLPSASDVRVTKETMRIYRSLEEELKTTLLKNYVALHIYPNHDSLKLIEPVIPDIEDAGVKVKVFDSKEAHEVTGLIYDEQEHVIYGEYEYLVSIRKIVGALHRKLNIIYGNASLRINNGNAYAIVGNEELTGDAVVLAAGGWNSKIAREAGIEVPLVTYGTRALAIIGSTRLNKYSISDYKYDYYTRPMGNLLDPIAFIAGDGNVKTSDLRQVRRLTNKSYSNWLIGLMKKRDPSMMISAIAGYSLVEMAYDYEPVIGKVPGVNNLYLIGGFDGYGAKLGPGLAFELARIIMGLNPSIDVSCYDINRFDGYEGQHDIDPHWEPVMLYLPAPNGASPCFYKNK